MLGLDYNSDSENEHSDTPVQSRSNAKSSLLSQLPPASNKVKPNDVSTNGITKSSNGLNLPPPASKKAGSSKKIVLNLGKIENDDDDLEQEQPVTKKPRLSGPAGPSSLLSMLPAPKKSTLELPPPQKVLGGGARPALSFSSHSHPSVTVPDSGNVVDKGEDDGVEVKDGSSTSLLPPSLLKSRNKKTALGDASKQSETKSDASQLPSVDFFSLGFATSSRTTIDELPSINSSSTLTMSAAPKVEEYRPPSPTQNDPYPGYYQQPNGQWAMYDPTYYKTYTTRWQEEYEAQIREYQQSLKIERGFEDSETGDLQNVNAEDQLDAARKEREEKKALTKDTARESQPKTPNIKINPQKISGIARTRHQLHSLLADAYNNRDALEEKIAQSRRNRKEAGNKYGF